LDRLDMYRDSVIRSGGKGSAQHTPDVPVVPPFSVPRETLADYAVELPMLPCLAGVAAFGARCLRGSGRPRIGSARDAGGLRDAVPSLNARGLQHLTLFSTFSGQLHRCRSADRRAGHCPPSSLLCSLRLPQWPWRAHWPDAMIRPLAACLWQIALHCGAAL